MADAQRLIAQHAQTSKLLGVGFVPVYRTGQGRPQGEAPAAVVEAKPERAQDESAAGEAGVMPAPAPLFVPEPEAPVVSAADAARRAATQARLDELRERYEREAPHKNFVTAHTRIVFGDGDPIARLVFVGEAPGEEEDRTGKPFVGRAGQLLNKMIAAMGLRREDVYICNVLKTRPPNNATPTLEEAQLCAPYLFEQLRIVSPAVIVCLGLPATRTVLNTTDAMARLRGQWHQFTTDGGPAIPVMPTYHPAFLLRQYTEENRRKVWSDLQMALEKLGRAALHA